jgi:hypothetical protein
MKSVIVHGLLAVFGLGLAYQTWTRKPEEETAPGSVVAAACDEATLQKIYLLTPTHEVTVEPKREGSQSSFWITMVSKSPEPDKAKAEDKDKPAKDKDAANPPKRFLANATFAEYIKRVAPLRALRSLGTLPKNKDADFGFDKVGTFVKLQCAGRTTDFDVGTRAFGASQRYFRDSKTHTTYLFDEQVVSDLESAAFKFMQADLHTFVSEDIEEITVDAHGAKKRLLHRDRKLPDQALWVDASTPAQRNELYNNWFARVARLRVRFYLPKGAEPGSDLKIQTGGSEPVLTIDYKIAGKPNGKLEIVRMDENGVGRYYARTETTGGWVAIYDSAAKEVEQDVGMVVGTEQTPAKPSGSPPAAPSSSVKPDDHDDPRHGHGMPTGHPALPPGHPSMPGPGVDPHAPH